MANISQYVDRAYEGCEFHHLIDAPVEALQGLSDRDAELLAAALDIKTIGDLARNKYFLRAQAIVALAQAGNR